MESPEVDDAVPEDSGEEPNRVDERIDGNGIQFEDTVRIETTGADLWAAVSDPEVLADCIPGAQRVEQIEDRQYECEVVRGVGHFTISIDAELELVELDEPNWVLTEGSAFDATTGSRFDVLAAMEVQEVDDETVDLAYSIDLEFTGGVATLGGGIVRRAVSRDLDKYFENVKTVVEPEADQ